jgi:hypothetical protein
MRGSVNALTFRDNQSNPIWESNVSPHTQKPFDLTSRSNGELYITIDTTSFTTTNEDVNLQ